MSQKPCSVVRDVSVVPAGMGAWRLLAAFHYRGGTPATVAKVFALVRPIAKPPTRVGGRIPIASNSDMPQNNPQLTLWANTYFYDPRRVYDGMELLGVIIYSQPVRNCALRNAATNRRYVGLGDAAYAGQLLQHEMRTISRVVIHPHWRGIGLGTRLVRETLPRAGTVLVEAIAAMGLIHPFFEKAGMTLYHGERSAHARRFLAACEQVGIDEDTLARTQKLRRRVERLTPVEQRFFEHELKRFAGVYCTAGILSVRRLKMPTRTSAIRTADILSARRPKAGEDAGDTLYDIARRALHRPAYFLWGLPW